MATKPTPPAPKEDPMDKGVWTVEKGTPPPMPDEGPTKDTKPPKKYAKGGFVRAADGCAQRGKTRGMMR